MSDVINLRTARKARDRQAAEARTAQNRAKFGRSKAERVADAKAAARVAKVVDGAKIDAPES